LFAGVVMEMLKSADATPEKNVESAATMVFPDHRPGREKLQINVRLCEQGGSIFPD
jgi:hypothetical protein